ncbi:MAG TPA: succinate dehydrogenase assembly factor 2 [Burkholderiales bacterium]|nr:succinate dehydrogenase assembly factor 2 [Burkholderiales bacterium]
MSMISWRSRRGMLELDILLSAFLERHDLDEAQQRAYLALLEYPDMQLWDIISGEAVADAAENAIVELIRTLNP